MKMVKRCLYVDPGVNDEIVLNEINLLNLSKCKIMHYTSFVGDSFKTQIELLDKLNDNTLLSFDPGMLYVQKGLKELKPILDKTDILLINENELRLLYEDYYKAIDCVDELSVKEIAVHILDEGIQTVVVKKGSKVFLQLQLMKNVMLAHMNAVLLTTTGAGDSFNSGFLYGKLNDYSLEESCKIGNWVASKAIEGFGMEKFPNLKDLQEFIN